ncbi:xylulose kinase-like protein, partial [Euroglyphus maynei]
MMESFQKLWLGFDLSTQQLKSIAINAELKIVYEACVHFDKDLPEFRTNGGIYSNPEAHTASAPVLMWIKALDLIFDRLRLNGLIDFRQVIGISGCGQQHGSVYWKQDSERILMNLNPSRFLHEQLNHCFTIQESPIWMDSSTTNECKELEKAIGGAQHLAQLTGSRAYERFTGNQISKIIKHKSDAYNQTERISLVSSFLASLFIGKYAPIDLSDGSGMNLLDIHQKQWSPDCIRAVSLNGENDLVKKLGEEIVPSTQIIGTISDYFVQRYDFSPDCYITAFTGDNPASLAGMCLGSNDIAVSLGTSDTIFFTLSTPQPSIDGHILCNPIDENLYMGMIVYKNG